MIAYTERILKVLQHEAYVFSFIGYSNHCASKLDLELSFINTGIAQTVLFDLFHDQMYFKCDLEWRLISE